VEPNVVGSIILRHKDNCTDGTREVIKQYIRGKNHKPKHKEKRKKLITKCYYFYSKNSGKVYNFERIFVP
jgi:hypothetical protein